MSTVESSLQRSPAVVESVQSLLTSVVAHVLAAVRGVAFWLTIPLPVVILGALAAHGLAAPRLLGGLVAMNVLCASVGHTHSPRI